MPNLHKVIVAAMLAASTATAAPALRGQYAGTLVGEAGHLVLRVEVPEKLHEVEGRKVMTVEVVHYSLIYDDPSVEVQARKFPAGTEVRVNGKMVGKSSGRTYILAESVTKVRD